MANRIIELADTYVGIKEVTQNHGWVDPVFEKEMREIGWKIGEAWCMYFCHLVWKKANEEDYKGIKQSFTPSVMRTYLNLKGRMSVEPKEGAIGFMQKDKGSLGHAFLVEALEGKILKTIEGNT